MSENLFELIDTRNQEKMFLRTPKGRRITYGDLDNTSARLANRLLSLGVKVGDRVAVQVEKSPESILLYLACLRAGAVYLPLNTAYTTGELEYFIADSQPRVVVCAPEKYEAIAALGQKLGVGATETLSADGMSGSLLAHDVADSRFQTIARASDDLAAILYTSGTTGRSKGAMLTHGNLASNARTLKEVWRFTGDDVLLHALPIYHTHGLFVATNVTLFAGAGMIFLPRFDPELIVRFLPEATVMMGVPTYYTRLLEGARVTRELTGRMRLFISGSAPLLAETHRQWRERTGHTILERYGMTETNMNTSNPYEGERIAGSVGLPLPGVDVRVVDPMTGTDLPSGQTGMIELKGPNVFKGYWRNPEKTAAEFRPDGYFITGDLGHIDDRGYVYISGRGKDLIISGGLNVYPKEIENEIDGLEGVEESAVIGIPHPDFGEGVTAVVTAAHGKKISEEGILAALKDRLANYKLPKRVLFVDSLPRNAMGKVQKAVLRERYHTLYRS
jgi:malonyl-CoA/methylmalonyl-CoA synthetase